MLSHFLSLARSFEIIGDASATTGMPRLVGSALARLAWAIVRSSATSFLAAASRLVCRPWTSPSQPFMRASLMRSSRLRMISASRPRCLGSTRSIGHLRQACSCWHGVPYGRAQVPNSSLRSWKCWWNSVHSWSVAASVVEEGSVGADHVVLEDRQVVLGGSEVGMPEDLGGDMDRQAAGD